MLRELSVQNLALIEDVHVELENGYCAWTGETGAGKSLLLTALALVLGGKSSPDMIRSGKVEARAAAVFQVDDPGLKAEIEVALGGALEDDSLIITRRITSQSRGSAHVNGLPVTITTLQKLGDCLVDIQGQLEGRALLEPARQRDLLDAYGGLDEKVCAYRQARQTHETLRQERQALVESADGRQRERALLEFERDELSPPNPKPGEYNELVRQASLSRNAGQIRSTAAAGYSLLYEADRSAQDILSRVARSLEPLSQAADELGEAVRTLARLADETREVAFSLREFAAGSRDDPARLEEIESRMAIYRRLATRFHCTPDDLADRLAST